MRNKRLEKIKDFSSDSPLALRKELGDLLGNPEQWNCSEENTQVGWIAISKLEKESDFKEIQDHIEEFYIKNGYTICDQKQGSFIIKKNEENNFVNVLNQKTEYGIKIYPTLALLL